MRTMSAGSRPEAEDAAPSWRRRGEADSVYAAYPRRRKQPERPRPVPRTSPVAVSALTSRRAVPT